MKTIMDNVDKQVIVHKLIAGEATQELRDQALATVMLSLWSQDDLKDLIRMVHNEECEKCPLKVSASNPATAEDEDGAWKKIALMLLKYGGWIIAIIAASKSINLPDL